MTKTSYQIIDGKLTEIGDSKSRGWYFTATYSMPILYPRACFRWDIIRPDGITDEDWDARLALLSADIDELNAEIEAKDLLNSNTDDE